MASAHRLPTCGLASCSKRVFVDRRTDTVHDYCSRGHARKALGDGNVQAPHGEQYLGDEDI